MAPHSNSIQVTHPLIYTSVVMWWNVARNMLFNLELIQIMIYYIYSDIQNIDRD